MGVLQYSRWPKVVLLSQYGSDLFERFSLATVELRDDPSLLIPLAG